jgi:pyruvate dehydrogenase E2 component (dihydrolipoamide acetyltransferase)
MPKEFKLPDLGEGIHEGEVVEVLVSVGDRVEDGQPILLIETDKATTEVPSPVDGIVKEIRVKAGDVVKVGSVLMVFDEKGEAESGKKAGVPGEEGEKKKEPEKDEKEMSGRAEDAEKTAKKTQEEKAAEGPKEKPEEAGKPERAESGGDREEGPVPASPSTRRLARELKVDLHQVPPSGPGGRVTSEDVRAFAEKGKEAEKVPEKPRKEEAPEPLPAAEAPPLPDFSQWGPVERIPLRSVRRATARQMALAWSQIPHVTHADVADITDLDAFRRKHRSDIEAKGGALSLTVFMLKVVVAALKMYPRFNSSLDTRAGEIIQKRYYNIGVAVDTERGLIVPVIRDVDRKSITELSIELNDLARRTREGKADREEMSGGTFTLTNIGPLGGTGFTPIVNYPQVGILGMAQARLQPVVRNTGNRSEVVPRLMLPLIIGFDHRVNDGADAARFLSVVIEALQDPEKLLMM